MATEGVYPKADGDIAFASEYSRTGRVDTYLFLGSSLATTGSGTAYQDVGSLVIDAGSLTRVSNLRIDYYIKSDGNLFSPRFQFSGAINNVSISGGNFTQDAFGELNAIIGSNFYGGIGLWMWGNDDTNLRRNSTAIGSNIDTSIPLVIKYQLTQADGAVKSFNGLSIKAGGII